MAFLKTTMAICKKGIGTLGYLIIIWICGLWLWKVTADVRHGSESGYYRGSYYHIVWSEHPFLSVVHWLTWCGIPLFVGLGCCGGVVSLWWPESKVNKPNVRPTHEDAINNHGQLWSYSEDAILIDQFTQMMSIKEIADRHKRSPRAIRMRLEKLGKLAPQPDIDIYNK